MEWSPFYVLPQAALTPSGLLQLDVADSEVELLRRSPIEVRHEGNDEPMASRPQNVVGEWTSRSTNLTLILTTHRLVLCDTNNDHRLIHLSNVHVIRGTGGPSFQHPRATYKMVVSTLTYGDLIMVFRGMGNAAQKDRDACLQQLETTMKRKLWERAQRMEEKTATQHAAARRRVGVDHILQRQKLSHQQAQNLANNAFRGDSDALLEQTGELLKVIHKSKALLERMDEGSSNGGSSSSSGGSSAEDREAAKKLAGLLSDMGMTSALTKSQVAGSGGGSGGFRRGGSNVSSGGPMTHSQRQYYELTARQVADFLLPRLKDDTNVPKGQGVGSGKGIMSLTDVYCLFNRARGTNLISPEDLRQACGLLGELNVGLSQRTFPSGVIVVQLDAMALDASHPERAQRLVDLCRPATTALEASHILNMSPLLAMEQLEEAERLGMLCRDVTLETVRFYPNKFVEW